MRSKLVCGVLSAAAFLAPAPSAFAALQAPAGDIAFSSDRDGNREIYLMDGDGANQMRVTNDPGADDTPTFSIDGGLLLFATDRTGNSEVFQFVIGNSMSSQVVTDDPASDSQPAFTLPLADRFVFVSNRSGNDDVYGQNRVGFGGLVNLSNNPAGDTAPNTDGHRVAFVSDRDGSKDIYLMNGDGSGLTRLTNDPSTDQAPNLSPDGQSIAFESNRSGNFEIYTMNLDGTGLTNVSNNPFSDREPAWSPDASKPKIAFQTNRDGNFEIYSMNADGTSHTRLTNSGGADVNPDWGPSTEQGYPRPKGASPLKASLVPAYRQCTAPNRMHGAPLGFGSCSPPVQESSFLTIGSPDSNGAAAASIASVLLKVKTSYLRDTFIVASVTDVRCLPAVSPSACAEANTVDGPDYTGELKIRVMLRWTDRYDGSTYGNSSTVQDFPFSVNAGCSNTSPSAGANCGVSTTANAVIPGMVSSARRETVQLDRIEVYDAGADGDADTTGDETLFLTQGVFIP